jgi:eukaryotic-like serine/threonine-protein kinase
MNIKFSNIKKSLVSRKAIKVYSGFILFLLLCVVCDRAVMPWYVNLGGVVKVPNVVGMKKEKAMAILKASNLEVIEAGKRFDKMYLDEGIIIFQSPIANLKVRENRRIYLTISAGEETVEVPDLIGKSIADAKVALITVNLRMGAKTYDSTNIQESEIIIGQAIPKGRKVKPNSYIGITVTMTNKPGQIQVPNLKNKSLTEAEVIIPQSKLKVGKIHEVLRSDLNPNTVVDQYPLPGTSVEEGKEIELWVVREPDSPLPEN